MALQEVNISDNLTPGDNIAVRWQILSYYPLMSVVKFTPVNNNTITKNGRLVGVEPGRWKIADRNSKIYTYEANLTVPQIPGDARVRFLASLGDGYIYMNANIPGGVDSRPYLSDGKEVLRTIV